jgi:hypothetical protein
MSHEGISSGAEIYGIANNLTWETLSSIEAGSGNCRFLPAGNPSASCHTANFKT